MFVCVYYSVLILMFTLLLMNFIASFFRQEGILYIKKIFALFFSSQAQHNGYTQQHKIKYTKLIQI